MTLVVETGSGNPLADSYVASNVVAEYATANGLIWLPDTAQLGDAAIRRATNYLEAMYRNRFPGYRKMGRNQTLEWPRIGAYVMDSGVSGWGYVTLPDNEVPREIIKASCELAIRELANPGSLSPDLEDGGAIRSVQAGTVNVTFAGAGLTDRKSYPAVDMILAPLFEKSNPYSGRIGRG